METAADPGNKKYLLGVPVEKLEKYCEDIKKFLAMEKDLINSQINLEGYQERLLPKVKQEMQFVIERISE